MSALQRDSRSGPIGNTHLDGYPCDYYGDPTRECACSPSMIARYRKRISGPLLDGTDIHMEVPRVQ